MNFTTTFNTLKYHPWSEHYLDYNGMKMILAENLNEDDTEEKPLASDTPNEETSSISKASLKYKRKTSEKFLDLLYIEVQKIALFVFEKQGEVAHELSRCGKQNSEVTADINNLFPHNFKSLEIVLHKYHKVGVELLNLIQFVDLNIKAVDRLLKQHDKLVSSTYLHAWADFMQGPSHSSTIMSALYHEESLDALCLVLQNGYTDFKYLQIKLENGTSIKINGREDERVTNEEKTDKKQDLEQGRIAEKVTSNRIRSPKELHRRHRSIQGLYQPTIDPKYCLQDCVEGAQSSFSLLQKHNRRFSEHYRPNVIDLSGGYLDQEDFMIAQIYAARRNIKQNRDVMNMLATTALGFTPEPPQYFIGNEQFQDKSAIKADYERAAALEAYKRASSISGLLNFVSSFIYMANYLIVVPTVVTYSEKVGANPALSSIVVGMTPFATIFSTIVYSWWTSYSYKTPLMFAASLNILGNVTYALGYPCNSMTFVLLGRLMSGMGSCRPINRRYIADAYSTAERTAASAHFVAVGSFGMALGPFLGSVLHRFAEKSTSPYWQVENAPGWFMAAVWSIYLVFHILYFVDPPKEEIPSSRSDKKVSKSAEEMKHLLEKEKGIEIETPIWKNTGVMINFFIYFVEKLLMECVSSSTSILTSYYFNWPGSRSGYYLSFLCFLVLPVNLVVAYLSKTYTDRLMMLVMQAATIFGCLIILRFGQTYHIEQYLLGSFIIVVFSNMVEGPNMSLLSKTIPKAWRKGFLNVGLLATEAATMGRTAGDAYLALCGVDGLEHQLNLTFSSMAILTSFTLWITYRHYDTLIPTEDRNI